MDELINVIPLTNVEERRVVHVPGQRDGDDD